MNGKTAFVLLSGVLSGSLCACVQPPEAAAPAAPPPPPIAAPAPAPVAEPTPGNRSVSIRGATCERLLELSPDDRAAASLFYIGYQAARFRARTINVGVIPSIEAQAIAYCEENPDRTVAQAFAEAYLQTRR